MVLEHRYCAVVGYDGTDFLGYQIQAKGRTVQGEIERSLREVTASQIRVEAAGRTDAGVHAVGQVIAFNTVWKHTLEDLHRALNATLPRDIVISDLKVASRKFHPRFDALSRSYRYTIISKPWPNVLQQRYACHVRKNLNVVTMRKASQFLLGTHDFASFGKPAQGQSTVRNLMEAEWSVEGTRLTFDITANAFLYRMVRTIVGTLIQVGLGQFAVDEIKSILEARDLTRSASPAPAHGLCLMKVNYPED